mgnify:CR=1 FL=1
MAKPSTRQGLIDYCFRKLGAPVLEINVDDDQVDDLVDDAIQLFNERHFDGVERMYLKYQLTQDDIDRGAAKNGDGVGIVTTTATSTNISGYGTTVSNWYETSNFLQVPDSVIGIEKIFKFDTSSISGGMFSIKYQLFLNDLYYFNSVNLLQYAMTKSYLEDIDFLLTTDKQVRFNKRQDRLYLDIDWGAESVDNWLILDCYRALDPDSFTQVYNDQFLKLYLTALIKRQWGQNLIKFRGVKLPGGIELNGREIYDDAEREIESIRSRMANEYELPPYDFIGWWDMALNPFFLQGSQSEQRLVQNLINEQLQIYGVEVSYIPRKFVNVKSIIQEVQSSKFDDNFSIEAYIDNYDGYSGTGDVLTKFGMSLRDEVTLTISREKFEDFIAPFMAADDYLLSTRPREGDLIFFPLGQRLFEIKFVEHEEPFYQLGKNYVYKLKCELFEYEDEVIDTSIEAIDTQVEDEGYIQELQLVGIGRTATAVASINTGYVREIFLNNDGSGFTGVPVVSISTSPSGQIGDNATAVAFTTERAGVRSVEKILMTNAGANYTSPPIITISGGGGTGAAATCSVETTFKGVIRFTMTDNGVGYGTAPLVTVAQPGSGTTATGISSIGSVGVFKQINSIFVENPGRGYASSPVVTIANPETISGIGTYMFNELVQGMRSGTQARVKSWDLDTMILKVSNVGIGTTTTGFFDGEDIKGLESGALYSVSAYDKQDANDKYNEGDIFETEADSILDFTESNPFGTY